jgi:cytochrome c553
MNHSVTTSAVLALVLATAAPLRAEEPPIRNCAWRHASSAQGFSVAPRLAGQREDYIVRQLRSFADHRRDDFLASKYMWAAVGNLDPEMAHNLAAYFATLPPKPVRRVLPAVLAWRPQDLALGQHAHRRLVHGVHPSGRTDQERRRREPQRRRKQHAVPLRFHDVLTHLHRIAAGTRSAARAFGPAAAPGLRRAQWNVSICR